MTVASDEGYRDPTNLQSKLQKHAAFEAELSSNKGRVDSVTEVCINYVHMYTVCMLHLRSTLLYICALLYVQYPPNGGWIHPYTL